MSDKIKIGISIGDVNGIGLEVIIKTLVDKRILDYCTPIVYGQTKVASFHRKTMGIDDFSFNVINQAADALHRRANMINCWEEDVKIDLGEANETGGKYAFLSLERATNDLIAGEIDALVTAPINKQNIQSEAFTFAGHTEYIQAKAGASDSLMLLMGEDLRVGVVTGHVPLSEVPKSITKEKILSKLALINQSLKSDFWIEKPKIAVLGLNPHAGDSGLLGKEEENIIAPAIAEANKNGLLAFGPYPADGFFANQGWKKFDAVLALFHVICYQTQNNKINLVFQNASKHLKKDGLFIFDFWYSPAVNYQKPEPRIKFISNKKFKIIRICQPKNYIKKKIVDVHYNFYINDIINKSLLNFKETHSMRYFTDSEINILAKKNSFKVLDMHEFLSRKTISRDTWGVSAILKKV